MRATSSSGSKGQRAPADPTLNLNQGQRVRIIGGPRKGQTGSIRDITDCMYELNIDNGDVGHVWKQNVTPEDAGAPASGYEGMTEEELALHYRLAKAVKNSGSLRTR
jgi:hypothetical protein